MLNIQTGTGMAINPRTGRLEQVYATYSSGDPGTAGPMQETGYYFSSDGPLPREALSLAGYAPGYYSDRSGTFDQFMERAVLGGLIAIGGAGAASEFAGSTAVAEGGGVAAEDAAAGAGYSTGTSGAGATTTATQSGFITSAERIGIKLGETLGTTLLTRSILGGRPTNNSAIRPDYLPQENNLGNGGLLAQVYGASFDPSGAFYGGSSKAKGDSGSPANFGGLAPIWIMLAGIVALMAGAFLIRR